MVELNVEQNDPAKRANVCNTNGHVLGLNTFSEKTDNFSETLQLLEQVPPNIALPFCVGCGKQISEKFYLKVSERAFHEKCLRCTYCNSPLDNQQSCFIKGTQVICRQDYKKHYSIKCSRCSRNIQSSDWVRKAKEHVYHITCFTCDLCKRQLLTGEEFALHERRILCRSHCLDVSGDLDQRETPDESSTKPHYPSNKSKRVRTNFNDDQIQILQSNFEADPNPDSQELERIARLTGLTKRVTQVWFQNSRARQKKYKERKLSDPKDDNIKDSFMNCNSNNFWISNDDVPSPSSVLNDSSLDMSSADELTGFN